LIKGRRFPKIFFGWWTVLATGIASGLGHGFYGFGISVFFKPLAAELGLSRAATSVATGISRLEGGVMSPLAGWLVDKYGPRWVVFTGICIAATGMALMIFINSAWTYYLVWGVLTGLGMNLSLTLAKDKAIFNWFIRRRGLALGALFATTGALSVITLPIITWLVITQGWRITCLLWSGIMFATLPLVWFFIKKERPEYYGLLPDGATIEEDEEKWKEETADTSRMIEKGVKYAGEFEEVEFTVRQAMKTSAYWMLLIAWCCGMGIVSAVNIHIIPFLTDMRIDPMAASSMMATMVFFTVPARFLGAFLGDYVRKDRLQFFMSVTFLLMAIGIIAFLLNQTIAMVYIFLILYGLGSGASIPVRLIIGGRYFGRKAFGTILGSILLLEAPIGFIAPIYAGWIYDTTGNYIIAFITFAVLATFAAFLMLLVRPPKQPAQVTDIRKFM